MRLEGLPELMFDTLSESKSNQHNTESRCGKEFMFTTAVLALNSKY